MKDLQRSYGESYEPITLKYKISGKRFLKNIAIFTLVIAVCFTIYFIAMWGNG